MAVHIATKTLQAIDKQIDKDGGASFRVWLGRVIPHMDDAYREDEFPFRSHMGASGIGDKCARKIWYGFRWSSLPSFSPRLLRLFNRGHLEEARFIALLLSINCEVYQQDENGKQFRISDAGGHFGGSGDGIVVNCPDLAPGQKALAEFKTASDAKFKKFKKDGVEKENWTYYIQTQIYMRKMGFAATLWMVVNKNNDELYAEIIVLNEQLADEYINRGRHLVFASDAPNKLSKYSSYWECKFCDYKNLCHKVGPEKEQLPHANCRTCAYSVPGRDGNWYCKKQQPPVILDKEQQFSGCSAYLTNPTFLQ